MSIFIGGAWPYANGSLHLGHLASLLPGDILARYFRMKGERVLYVSGSDCHGTPIALRADIEQISPAEITDRYHEEFRDCFQRSGFTYDLYSRTDQPVHHKIVQELFLKIYEKGLIYKKNVEQIYCADCQQFLPDRYVEGTCPFCGNTARGDQCDYCSSLIDPLELLDRRCKICEGKPVIKESEHFYFALSEFENELKRFLKASSGWRENAVKYTERYLEEGLQDRAISRDISWGINIPLKGYENKKLYVWIEAVLGYYSASVQWAEANNEDWKGFWADDVKSYYVHGKDNIPFHTLILPALLLSIGNLHLPDYIISSEFLNIEGKKLSTSKNWAVWVPEILENYHPDTIRYYLTINGPEKRDCNFSWEEFINSHNGELLGAYGNFVNRTLVFAEKYFSSEVPDAGIDITTKTKIEKLYNEAGKEIEKGEFRSALENIFSFIRSMNKYYDEEEPWITRKEDISRCKKTINTCIQSIANLANLLNPFLPFSTEKIREILKIEKAGWSYLELDRNSQIGHVELLFHRIEKERIEIERRKLLEKQIRE
ncbi:MAG: methionine--tRNA ligase [Halanaerobiaceae bacterium]|nr:methionine--tRNA ligase [Halanaerobiaceae bacterium]